MTENAFLVGLDFGSFKTSVVASNGRRESLRTAVGRPRDHMPPLRAPTLFALEELPRPIPAAKVTPTVDGPVEVFDFE